MSAFFGLLVFGRFPVLAAAVDVVAAGRARLCWDWLSLMSVSLGSGVAARGLLAHRVRR
jgi:hypothetical protein